jgi:peptide/nickel transport system substrate-binding protein
MSSVGQQTRESEAESSTAFTSQANQTKPYGGTLRVAFVGVMPSTLNPLIDYASANYNTAIDVWQSLFDALVMFDEKGSPMPGLARDWEVAPEGSNITFHLFQNVTWHDGVGFNASDVKFSFDAILYDPEVENTWKLVLQEYDISSVEILDEYTVSINLATPHVSAVSIVGFIPIIPRHKYDGTELRTNPCNENPVGTGPFTFVNWVPNYNITLSANQMYYKGRPYLDQVILRSDIQPADLSGMLLNNVIDLVPDNVDPSRINELNNVIGVSTLDSMQPAFYAITLNFSNPILADVRVRKALAYAINNSEICKDAFLGYASPSNGPVPPLYSSWYNPNVTEYRFNQTLAEELLDKAGYPRSNVTNIRFNLGFMISTLFAAQPWKQQAFEMICRYWENIGVNVTRQIGGGGTPWDCRISGWIWDFSDPDDMRSMYYTNADLNSGGYSNAQVDHLFDEGRLTSNESSRKQIYDDLQLLLLEDLPMIFLWYPDSIAAYNNDFHGLNPYPFGEMHPFVLEKIWYEPTLSGEGNCPYRVRFIDNEGRISGYYNGTSLEQIPNSTYSGSESDPQLVRIRLGSGNYTVELEGTENGTYSFELVNLASNYKHVSVVSGTIQTGQIKQYSVSVYPNSSMQVSGTVPLDVYSDGKIDMRDISRVARLFAISYPNMEYDPICDIVFDWKIDMRDIGTVARHFGEHYP